jgi:hypothetical protein
MADEADQAQERMDFELAIKLKAAGSYHLPEGVAGDCDLCGEWSGRLIDGECAPCRDKYARVNR